MVRPHDDLAFVIRAAEFAAHKHRYCRRKDAQATPYINHPLTLAAVLCEEGGVRDPIVLAAALLHDTIEEAGVTYEELRSEFGADVADIVVELTDVKFLSKPTRKKLQVSRAGRASARAKQVKLADKISNLRDILRSPPVDWPLARKQQYFDWARTVVDRARGVSPPLERSFDRLYRQRPA